MTRKQAKRRAPARKQTRRMPKIPLARLAVVAGAVAVVGFTYQLSVPFVSGIATLPLPDFMYLLPRESLGVPREGAITPC